MESSTGPFDFSPDSDPPNQGPTSPTPDPSLDPCRLDLGDYGAYAHGHTAARHHRLWIDKLTDVIDGRSSKRKLLIVAPPGHAKSTWISLLFPPWYLGQYPSHSLLFFTSSDTMARQFGTTVKSTLEGNDRHAQVFPEDASRPDRSRGWSTDGLYLRGAPAGGKDPSYRALGYGASVVGARAHGIILDDPLTQDQARSEVEQRRATQYHDMTVDSRLHPDGWELAIMTRWHEQDLAAHLSRKPDWEVLELPALSPDGTEALWPERFPVGWLLAKRADIGVPMFEALYQGNPYALGGNVFREAAWFRTPPADLDRSRLIILQAWDLAFSEKASADYSACVTLGLDPRTFDLHVLNVWRGQTSHVETRARMVELIKAWRPVAWAVEESAFKARAVQQLAAEVASLVLMNLQVIKPVNDKVLRARLPAGRAEAGKLYADHDAAWWPSFLSECLSFPNGAHDDQVDALSLACHLAATVAAELQAPKELVYTRG